MRDNFNYFYNNTLKGWNKIQIILYDLDNQQLDLFTDLVNNYSCLCDFYLKFLKRRIFFNPINIKSYKEYFKYKNLINIIICEFEELYNIKINEIRVENTPIRPEHVIIKGFKKYDE